MAPERRIVGFHQDEEGQWVAELECGHARHVRHDPPWEVRPWTRSAEGRAGRLGTLLPCLRCGEAAAAAREDALIRGLCAEGADEVARDAAPGPASPDCRPGRAPAPDPAPPRTTGPPTAGPS